MILKGNAVGFGEQCA